MAAPSPPTRWIIGCMTGTSLDGLDLALVEVTGTQLSLRARIVAHQSHPLGALREPLLALASHEAHPPAAYLHTARRFGELHAESIAEFCQQHLPTTAHLHLVAAHGQTICHLPMEHLSWQLFDPWPIVRRLNVPVVHDLRQADLIAGGEGAPITPIVDWLAFRHPSRSRTVVNLGGICNITHLPASATPDDVSGRDVGPCNLLLDGLAQRLLDTAYDTNGRQAASGTVDETVVERIQQRITSAVEDTGTLGREQFTRDWLDALQHDDLVHRATPADLLASAAEAVARHIGDALVNADEVIVAGGGAKNPVLVQALQRRLGGVAVQSSDALGIPVDAREAFAMAVLGALCEDGCAITLPQVTGARASGVAGVWVGRRG
ncbi:MAG: anhydro-N-acetylmuramic acid kinase [Phycisphaeraceae bacterium]